MRLFWAISLPDAHKRSIEKVLQPLRSEEIDARWVTRENLHVTVKFLGEVEDEKVNDVIEAARGAALKTPSLQTHLTEFGCFPNCGKARVLWVGIDDPGDTLANLAARLDEELGQLGLKRESRKLHPHVTVARLREPRSVREVLDRVGPMNFETAPFEVGELVAFRSYLSPKGSTYERVASAPLG